MAGVDGECARIDFIFVFAVLSDRVQHSITKFTTVWLLNISQLKVRHVHKIIAFFRLFHSIQPVKVGEWAARLSDASWDDGLVRPRVSYSGKSTKLFFTSRNGDSCKLNNVIAVISEALGVLARRNAQMNVCLVGRVQHIRVDWVHYAIIHDEEVVSRLELVRIVADEVE